MVTDLDTVLLKPPLADFQREHGRTRAAVEILKSTGDIGGNDRIITEITIEQDTVKIFQKAIEEVEEDIQEADYELAPSLDSDDS